MKERELDLIIESLKIRICLIETGKPMIRASEAKQFNVTPKKLSDDQIELIVELTNLIKKMENN